MSAQSTASPLTRILGVGALIATGTLVWLGLFVTKPDVVQGEFVRLIYVHPAVAWVSYMAFSIAAVASLLYLYPRTRSRFWDLLAGASAEVGVVFCALMLVTGSIWGRPTWGVWWTWDARLTSAALLFVLFVGYLALRRMPADAHTRAKRCAVAAIVAAIDIPIVHLSVDWWLTLHQDRTLLRPDPTIEGLSLVTMLLGLVTMTLVFAWLTVHRFRVERLMAETDDMALKTALAERRTEGAATTSGTGGGS